MSITGGEVRAAKTYLGKHAKARTKDISPRRFAAAAKEQGAGFSEVLKLISYYYASADEREQMRHDQLNRSTP